MNTPVLTNDTVRKCPPLTSSFNEWENYEPGRLLTGTTAVPDPVGLARVVVVRPPKPMRHQAPGRRRDKSATLSAVLQPMGQEKGREDLNKQR